MEGCSRKELIPRDKASVGMFSTPLMYLMSDVYWKIKSICQISRGEYFSDEDIRAYFWFVKIKPIVSYCSKWSKQFSAKILISRICFRKFSGEVRNWSPFGFSLLLQDCLNSNSRSIYRQAQFMVGLDVGQLDCIRQHRLYSLECWYCVFRHCYAAVFFTLVNMFVNGKSTCAQWRRNLR